MKNILFSVLIPVYNVSEYLGECIESVLNQTYQNFEIILADDGSTDNSPAICDEYAQKDSRIKAFHKENERLMMTRRFSIKKATGDYILFLDSDDYWEPDLLEKINSTITEHNCDMVVYRYKSIYDNKVVNAKRVYEGTTVFDKDKIEEFYKKFLSCNDMNPLWIKAVKREVVLKDETDYSQYKSVIVSGEDAFQSIPLIVNSEKIAYINEFLVNYRIRENSISRTFNVKKFQCADAIFNRKIEYYEKYFGNSDKVVNFMIPLVIKGQMNLIAACIRDESTSYKQKVEILKASKNTSRYEAVKNAKNCNGVSKSERLKFSLYKNNLYLILYFVVRFNENFISKK